MRAHVLAASLAAFSMSGAQSVPVTKVMLFSSGVGYFEHAGTVHGNASTELRFKTSQINDILKSLVLQDEDGGRVGAITYPSQDPLDKTLRSFQVDITKNPSLADLLNQLRGARVTVASQAENLSGTILGVERREKGERGEGQTTVPVLNLMTGASIRSIELPSISSLTLDDPQLQDELTKALTALVQARVQDKKPVSISFNGTGDRRVRIGYVVETPIWKTSYRLLLGAKNSAYLQGWAMVENQTESDWNDVSLSLVSGRPISFIMDLYQPLYAPRPIMQPELYASLTPQLYDGALQTAAESVSIDKKEKDKERRDEAAASNAMLARAAFAAKAVGGMASASPAPMDAVSSIQPLGTSGRMGELFQYSVGNVTLARQKSAMLPIIDDSVEVERLSIYNDAVLASHPLNGVRMKNTSGKHLLKGPLTVMDGGYAGDARIDDVPPGQDRLLSYGIDLETTATSKWTSLPVSVTTAKIVKGILMIGRHIESTKDYSFENKGIRDKTIIIEHAIRGGWKLVDTGKPIETTENVYRFKGDAPAHKVATLTVKEETIQSESYAILPMDVTALIVYQRTGAIPQSVRDAIAKAVSLKNTVTDLERQMAARTTEINAITVEQNRMRENMRILSNTTQYYQRLLAKLNEQESRLETLQTERDSLTARRDAARKELEDYLSNLSVG